MIPLREGIGSPGATAALSDYFDLAKPRLSLTVVLSGVVGYCLGASSLDLSHLLGFTLGTLLVVAGANAFNQVLERESDARMRRTAQRPIPSGRISPADAGAAAALASFLGLALLLVHCGPLTAALGAAALAVYVLLYTPMKRRSSWSTLPGAVAGAMPTLMGYSAATGTLAAPAWCLFGILFFWQFPHTWAIAATYREDFERAGNRALPGRGLALGTIVMTFALLLTSLIPSFWGGAGSWYTLGALVLGGAFLASAVRFGDGTRRSRATALLAASLLYLPLILAVIALGAFGGEGF
jgi:protoheme IX farnesyltransferase